MSQAEKTEDRLADAKRQGQAQFDSIKEMVEAYQASGEPEAERAIHEDALSVEVRSGWVAPGAWDAVHGRDRAKPEEYAILLCTGGPACRIVGELNEYCEPSTARLEVQDWFQPWTAMRPSTDDCTAAGTRAESILLAYARCFYFGEG